MSLAPEDYVGWTVVVHENDSYCPVGIFYCVGLVRKTLHPTELQLAGHGEARDSNESEAVGVNWWAPVEFVARLRQGDYAP